jgi:hypothetical protein
MHFPLLKAGAAALLFCSSLAAAELTSTEIVDKIDDLRTDTVTLQGIAQSIGVVNELEYLLKKGSVYVRSNPFPHTSDLNCVKIANMNMTKHSGPRYQNRRLGRRSYLP